MPARSPTLLLLRDEFVGYAKSKVMLVLWFLMPALTIAGYLVAPANVRMHVTGRFEVSATLFMSTMVSILAGYVAGTMVAVDIVNERNRKVYELFLVRPMRRDAIVWSKFLAVTGCIAIACVVSVAFGIAADALRGDLPTGRVLLDAGKSMATLMGVLVVSTADGVFIGILSKSSVALAVILVLQVGQNLVLLPMLPGVLGILPDLFWVVMLLSLLLALALVLGAAALFRRAEF